jgi:hypothetical protein
MAEYQVGVSVGYDRKDFQGLSTDTKPTEGLCEGSTFYELDTKNTYIFSVNINPATSNGWWVI